MRQTILCALALTTWIAAIEASHAQSPYNYSWCGVYPNRYGARSCRFNNYEQCIANIRPGIGGYCTQTRSPPAVAWEIASPPSKEEGGSRSLQPQ
jgi:Protein of unknown function (DUF3551)